MQEDAGHLKTLIIGVTDEADTPVITTDMEAGNMVTINFSNTVSGKNGTFYIPAPLGTYESVTAEMLDGAR